MSVFFLEAKFFMRKKHVFFLKTKMFFSNCITNYITNFYHTRSPLDLASKDLPPKALVGATKSRGGRLCRVPPPPKPEQGAVQAGALPHVRPLQSGGLPHLLLLPRHDQIWRVWGAQTALQVQKVHPGEHLLSEDS